MLSADDVVFSYGAADVLKGVSLSTHRGEVLGLIGANGSGKTTLLRTLYGALRPRSGTVTFDGEDIRSIGARKLAQNIAVVVQEPPSDLEISVIDTVLMGRTPHRTFLGRDTVRADRLAVEALEEVGALHLAHRGLNEISGGEKQRVLLARALVQEPKCLLLDEPTNHLDIGYQQRVLELVTGLDLTTVVVLHDLNLAARHCDRIVLLDDGKIRASGTPGEVLNPSLIEGVYSVGAQLVHAEDGTPQMLFEPEKEPSFAARVG